MKPRLRAEELTGMISLRRDKFASSENLRRCFVTMRRNSVFDGLIRSLFKFIQERMSLKVVVSVARDKAKFVSGASFQLFLGGPTFLFSFQCHRTIEKLEKYHFICSNLALFIVPFFLSFFFLLFLFFSSFSFFFFFFLFPWGGDGPPASLKWRPWFV